MLTFSFGLPAYFGPPVPFSSLSSGSQQAD